MNFLPHSQDAERALICSFLNSPKSVGQLCAERRISREHMHIPAHGVIYAICLEKWADEKPIDIITVTQTLRDRGALESVGGPAYVSDLFTFLPTAVNADHYAEILQEKLILRQIIAVCTEAGNRSMNEQDGLPNLLSEVQSEIAGIGMHQAFRIPTMRENIIAAVEALEGRIGNSDGIIRTGLAALDAEVGPIERGNLMVIGGQTKSGKSLLAGQIALNIALNGQPVLFISLEMSERELTLRMLSSLARVDPRNVQLWNGGEHERFSVAVKTLADVPLSIVTRIYKLSEITAACRQAAARPGIPLAAIVLDYAQLCEGTRGGKEERRQQEIAEISRTCKRIAGSLNVLFVLLTQLNDDGRTRESRDIENDANLMMEVGHNRDTGERGVKVVLARSAPSGQRLRLRIIPQHTRVEDDQDMDVDEPEEKKARRKKG